MRPQPIRRRRGWLPSRACLRRPHPGPASQRTGSSRLRPAPAPRPGCGSARSPGEWLRRRTGQRTRPAAARARPLSPNATVCATPGRQKAFAAWHGMRPEDRVVADRNSHKQQADERRRSRGQRGKVGVVGAGHPANRSWHGRSAMSMLPPAAPHAQRTGPGQVLGAEVHPGHPGNPLPAGSPPARVSARSEPFAPSSDTASSWIRKPRCHLSAEEARTALGHRP